MAETVKQRAAEALHQTDEIRACDERCADCGVVHKATNVVVTLYLHEDAVGKIEVQSRSVPANWARFGDGYLCPKCWKKVREWQAAKRREEAGI